MDLSAASLAALASLAAVAAAGTLRFRWLSAGGGVAALVVGAAALAGAGAAGVGLLLAFFVSASLLTRLPRGRDPKGAGPAATPAGTGAATHTRGDRSGRTARQVLANGGVAAGAALLGLAGALPAAGHAFAGALAAATADTWASEVGTAVGGPTRLVTTGQRVRPGRSGGVSAAGTAAGLAGALGMGGAAALLLAPSPSPATPSPLLTAAAGGIAGMALDSLLGATLEGRYRFVDNDAVNLAGTAAGALLAWSLAVLTG